MEEIWKDIKGFESKYKISSNGNCYSYFLNRNLKPTIDTNGYLLYKLSKDGKQYTIRVHRLVAEAFLEIPEELKHLKGTRYLQVNHKDEDKTNNNVNNLEWCDNKYNINYGTCIERIKNSQHKKPVLQYDKNGNFIKEWVSLCECHRNGFHRSHIIDCCNGKQKTHKGFIWKYKNEQ